MAMYIVPKPMTCGKCWKPMERREVVTPEHDAEDGTIGPHTIPYYTCNICGRTQMSELARYVYKKTYGVTEMRLGFEANAAKHLKEGD